MSKAEITRANILRQAFDLIYKKGYQATSVDDILTKVDVTKGAFYYHFKNKDEMGLAMIREVMHPGMIQVLVTPLLNSEKPIEDIYNMMHQLLMKSPFFEVPYGCPAVNLIEEMSPINASFNHALQSLMVEWQEAIQSSIKNGKKNGMINSSVNEQQVAYFIMSGYSGIRNMGKMMGRSCYNTYLKEFKNYLNQLQ